MRHTTGSGGDSSELELSKQVVVLSASTLALEYLDQHTRLVVGESRENLTFLGWDGSIALNQRSHDTTSSLDTKGKWGNVEQQDLLSLRRGITRKNGGLDGSTVGDSFVGIDGLIGLLPVEKVGHQLLDLGDTGRTTNQDNLVDRAFIDLRVAKNTLDRLHSGAEEILA